VVWGLKYRDWVLGFVTEVLGFRARGLELVW
jgi:hypothetical protein